MDTMAGSLGWLLTCCTVLQLLVAAKAQTLPETDQQATECFGTGRTISGTCSANERIAVLSVKHGVKTTASGCALSYTSSETPATGCCASASGDCSYDFTNTGIHDACTGRDTCTAAATTQNEAIGTSCDNTFHVSSTYNILNFYCIPETRIQRMCDSGTVTATGSPVYLLNQNYPSGISSTDTSCTCSVQAADCSASIIMYTVHRNLDCSQSLTITDGTGPSAKVIDCNDNDGYTITTERILSAYLKIDFANSAATDTGVFWTGYLASDNGQLTVTCPAISDACSTTTTTTTTATTTTTGSGVTVLCPGIESGCQGVKVGLGLTTGLFGTLAIALSTLLLAMWYGKIPTRNKRLKILPGSASSGREREVYEDYKAATREPTNITLAMSDRGSNGHLTPVGT